SFDLQLLLPWGERLGGMRRIGLPGEVLTPRALASAPVDLAGGGERDLTLQVADSDLQPQLALAFDRAVTGEMQLRWFGRQSGAELRRWTLPLRGEMQLPLWGPQAGTWFASATSDGDSAWLLVALDTAPAHGELTLRPAATVDWEWHGDDGELRL